MLTMKDFVLQASQQKEIVNLPDGPEQNRAVKIYAGKIKFDLSTDNRMNYYYAKKRELKAEGLLKWPVKKSNDFVQEEHNELPQKVEPVKTRSSMYGKIFYVRQDIPTCN